MRAPIKQATFAGLAFDARKQTTKRDRFFAEMDKVVHLVVVADTDRALLHPKAAMAATGDDAAGVYSLQQWYVLTDPGMEEALYELGSMRRSPVLS